MATYLPQFFLFSQIPTYFVGIAFLDLKENKMIYNNIIELIGKTPIVKLNNLVDGNSAEVYVKLEYFNPSGSVKDRAALGMIEDFEKRGILSKDKTIVEPTSGNTGIGIAMIAAAKGYKVVLVMPDTLSVERRRMLSAYGAELLLTDGTKGMKEAIRVANELVETKGYVILSQFDNEANPIYHRETTGEEIKNDFDSLDAFVAGVGTGGTVNGVAQVLKSAYNDIKIVAVEPQKSPVISGGNPGPHKLQGIGAGFVPQNYDAKLVDEVVQATEEDAFKVAVDLARKEGIFVGISSGAAVHVALEEAKKLGKGKKVLVIAPDGGNRYLSIEGLF